MLNKWMFLSCIRGPGHIHVLCRLFFLACDDSLRRGRKLGKFGGSCCATRKVSRRSLLAFAVNAVYPNRAALNVQDIFMSMVDACLAAGDMKSLVEVFQELV